MGLVSVLCKGSLVPSGPGTKQTEPRDTGHGRGIGPFRRLLGLAGRPVVGGRED